MGQKILKLLVYLQILICDSFCGYPIENNPKNTKHCVAQKLLHGLRALGRQPRVPCACWATTAALPGR